MEIAMKKNKMTHCTVTIMLALFIALALAAHSAAGPGRPALGGGGPLMRCIDQLNLSVDTRAKVDALIQKHSENMAAERDAMRGAMDTYYSALTTSPQDSAALAKAQQAIIALEQKRTENRLALEKSIVALLSADDAAKLGRCLSSAQTAGFPGEPPSFGGKTRMK
jgi:Spy/CpxP family protein refolding chaperone